MFPVTIVNDDIHEVLENFQARLELVSGNGVRVGSADTATISITDDDGKFLSLSLSLSPSPSLSPH